MSESFILHTLSPRLDRYKRSGRKHHFKCPSCHEGKNKKSNRGGLFEYEGAWLFNCFNCGTKMNLEKFLYEFFPDLLMTLKLENLQPRKPVQELQIVKPYQRTENWFVPASRSKTAIAYLITRGVTNLHNIFYSESPPVVINSKVNAIQEPCLVFPLVTFDTLKASGYQLRALRPDHPFRFSTIIETKSIFDNSQKNVPRIVLEGVFDALSVHGSVAVLSAQGTVKARLDDIWCLDQEPGNPHIVARYEKLIAEDKTVSFLPKKYRGLDPNNMLVSGMSPHQIRNEIVKHSTRGIMSKVRLLEWQS